MTTHLDPEAARLAGLPENTPAPLIALAVLAAPVPTSTVPRSLPVLCQPAPLPDGAPEDQYTYWHVDARGDGRFGWLWPDMAPGKYLPRHLNTPTVRRIRAAYGGTSVELRTVARTNPVIPRGQRLPDRTGTRIVRTVAPDPVKVCGVIASPDGWLTFATIDGGAVSLPPTVPPPLDSDRLDGASVVEVTSPVLTWETPEDLDAPEGWHVAWRQSIRGTVTAGDVARWRALASTAGDASTAAWIEAHEQELVRETRTVAPLAYNTDPDRIDRGPGRFASPWLDVTPVPTGVTVRPAARIPHPPREGVEDGRLPWQDRAGDWRAGRTARPVEVRRTAAPLDGRPAHRCPLDWHGPVLERCPACHHVAPSAAPDPVTPVAIVPRPGSVREASRRARQRAVLPTSPEALAGAMRTANRSAEKGARLWAAAPVEVRHAIATMLGLPLDATARDVLDVARHLGARDVATALAVSAASGTGVATGGTD